MEYRAVIFDLDGLLFNTEDVFLASGTTYLARRGFEFELEVRNQMMGRPAPVSLKILKEYFGIPDSVEEIRYEIEDLFSGYLEEILAPMPGALELLDRLDEISIPFAVATSSSREYAKELLQRFELHERFVFLLGGNDVAKGKPNPEIYLTAAEKLGMNPAEILVFEDSGNGCAAAVAAGTNVIAVPNLHNIGQTYEGALLVADTLLDPQVIAIIEK